MANASASASPKTAATEPTIGSAAAPAPAPAPPVSITDNMSEFSDFHEMGSMPMCIALDKSGSTYGATIAAELDVVHQFCTLRQAQQHQHQHSDSNSASVQVLPWCHRALEPVIFPKSYEAQRRIGSGGGTDPSSLYQSPTCLAALRSAGIWVLMTDGKIENKLVEKFATETLEMTIHNKPCVIIVFGDSSYGRPAACDISVGIAVYANVPHCLLLFHDIPTGIVRILQAKGNFQGLLPLAAAGSSERIKLRVNQYTAWPELPRIAYKDLFSLELSIIRDLEPDEMALQDGLIVNIPDMLAGKVDEATIEKIIHNSDNVRSLALAAQTKGTGKNVADWLISHQLPASSREKKPKDVDHKAHKAISALLEALNSDSSDESVTDLRRQVRQAHALNLKLHRRKIKGDADESEDEARKTNRRLYNAAKASAGSMKRRRTQAPKDAAPVVPDRPPSPALESGSVKIDWDVGHCAYASDRESPRNINSPADSPQMAPTAGALFPELELGLASQLPDPGSEFISRLGPSSLATYTPFSDGDYALTYGEILGGQQSSASDLFSSGAGPGEHGFDNMDISYGLDSSKDLPSSKGLPSLKDLPSSKAPSLGPSCSSTDEESTLKNSVAEGSDGFRRSRGRKLLLGKRRARTRSRSPSLRRSTRDPILVPGFERFKALDKAGNELRGRCALCHYDGAVLTLLLRVPPPGRPTVGFPREGDNAQITFPLAIGGFAETRALSTFVCCDSCAFHLVRVGTSPLGDTVIAAVPMVSLRQNQAAVLDALDLAIRGRIDSGDLLAVFMAMLDAELNDVDRNISSGRAHADIALFQKSAEWFQRNLNNLIEVPASLSIDFQPHSSRPPENKVLRELLELSEFRDPAHPSNCDLLLLRYPIPGFLVLLRQICVLYPSSEHGQTLVFHKLMLLILETLNGPRASAKSQLAVGDVLRHVETAKSPISALELEDRGLLEPGTLEAFKRWSRFESFAQRCGPALTIFLRHWLRGGFGRQSAVSVFNLLKRDEVIRDIFVAPLAMSADDKMDSESL
ncbi:hypothetical protein EDB81DRAFT_54242 [Dactylonectria macrodidyma]|uniref:Uncharacterized protein n=1 Tax=Dactylonectria macrodidyma TaxID=307937 RepID=A0A9P9ERU7_9HYPO|nr:hypothetical protein EDB81DRAFT_54242 [Dactylonectria macrodidyma]